MATDVVMPQMGESVAEGTIVRWIKKVGDRVERDEPLFEISTDKVDAEIPSPVAGVLSEIRAHEGDTVPVNSVVAVIGEGAAAPAPPDRAGASAQKAPEPSAPSPGPAPADRSGASAQQAAEPSGPETGATDDDSSQRSSPLVRRIAKEHQVDIAKIHGTGISGRVTKADILDFIGKTGQEGQEGQEIQEGREGQDGKPAGRSEKMSVMRKKIAEHMVLSRRTSAHVHSVFEVNFSRVAQIRQAKKDEYERAGGKLTFLSFILKAVSDGLRAVPVVNASLDGDNIIYHEDVNLGVAVALDWGLIVPVIKKAQDMNLLGLSRAVAELAARARAKQLKPDDVSGGTFTITNPGVFGAQFGMPIINQPQVAILGVGAIEKRAVVIDDAIAIRTMAYLTLGYDHRLIDGAVADKFLAFVKHALENWDPEQV
jgi:pyruvate dehydrogenase E2 component (dihydrolipoamide acetyltransferase)